MGEFFTDLWHRDIRVTVYSSPVPTPFQEIEMIITLIVLVVVAVVFGATILLKDLA